MLCQTIIRKLRIKIHIAWLAITIFPIIYIYHLCLLCWSADYFRLMGPHNDGMAMALAAEANSRAEALYDDPRLLHYVAWKGDPTVSRIPRYSPLGIFYTGNKFERGDRLLNAESCLEFANSSDPRNRILALLSIETLDPESPVMLDLLLRISIDDPDPDVRILALDVLLGVDEHSDQAKRALMLYLRDQDPARRIKAAVVSLRIDSNNSAAISTLEGLSLSGTKFIRSDVALSLSRLRPFPGTALQILANGLRDSDSKVRADAVFSIGRIGKDALPLSPCLAKFLIDDDVDVRIVACQSIGILRIKDPAIVDILTKMSKSANAIERNFALQTLGRIGELVKS